MQTIEQDAVNATRKARRQKSGHSIPQAEKMADAASTSGLSAEDFGKILPSDEIERW